MIRNLLTTAHPLVREAWEAGFNPIVKGEDLIVLDPLPMSDEDVLTREGIIDDLERRIEERKKEVLEYLKSLQKVKVLIRSKRLNDHVWIVGTEELLTNLPEGDVGYLAAEVYRIKSANWSDEVLQKIHLTKKILGGNILHVQRAPDGKRASEK
ncbi:hypothetical protein [Candidatus Manganitrophus noduliformans]|uniref:TubC N-terminal docking domain-containing protein n=1 Tax=Candidatus Manganitrophus noduliformans TaxID=2606439 RepID=A0A7X6DQA6_9BACT|nr:hypothetical protein [Candidatus Manganitrophus noduliformans]NKE71302.1 hypothetical protein [Candidatus Manganitrophus noduliformans]